VDTVGTKLDLKGSDTSIFNESNKVVYKINMEEYA